MRALGGYIYGSVWTHIIALMTLTKTVPETPVNFNQLIRTTALEIFCSLYAKFWVRFSALRPDTLIRFLLAFLHSHS